MGRSLVRTSSTVYAGCMCDFNISEAATPARYEPAEPAGPSYPLESERDGMYGDEGEGYKEEEVPADQEMVEGDKPVEGKGKAIDRT